ncbi:MAG: ATP-binding protein [Muribaculaceae bacterium]|nr:ATP-binding protein [Muribaculaceae bacterium]
MAQAIIGREKEIMRLKAIVESDKAELVAIYGRRRVGKTFLVKEFFKGKFDFYATGIFEGKRDDQLAAFCDALSGNGKKAVPTATTWIQAFILLRNHLAGIKKKRIIVFMDELPWFDTRNSQFLKAFEWFWNSWGSTQHRLKLIVCGSATTWMTDKFINGKGGLYNRTTERMHLSPFNLHEAALLLKSNGLDWEPNRILDAYMIFGGMPLYLSMLKRELSLEANVDNLFFGEGAPLTHEYAFLLRSLFNNSDYYQRILDAISQKNMGISRQEIARSAKMSMNGSLTSALNNLISCDFIRRYSAFGKSERDALFQLTDLFILFYKRFVERYNGKDEHHWVNSIDSPARRTWTGLAFEQVCLLHVAQIKQALGIAGIQTDVCSWRHVGDAHTNGAQIDLLIARRDKTINLCEMKYADSPYEITGKLCNELRERKATFRSITGTRYALHQTMVSPYGIKPNAHAQIADQVVTLKHLFADKQ